MAVVPDVLTPGVSETTPPAVKPGKYPVGRFIVRRVATGIVTLFVVSILIFLATNILPGNVADGRARPQRDTAAGQQLDAELNINHSLPDRYLTWLGDIAARQPRHTRRSRRPRAGPIRRSPRRSAAHCATASILAGLTTLLLIPLTLVLGSDRRRARRAQGRPRDLVPGAGDRAACPSSSPGTVLIFIFFNKLNLLPPVALFGPGSRRSPTSTR